MDRFCEDATVLFLVRESSFHFSLDYLGFYNVALSKDETPRCRFYLSATIYRSRGVPWLVVNLSNPSWRVLIYEAISTGFFSPVGVLRQKRTVFRVDSNVSRSF